VIEPWKNIGYNGRMLAKKVSTISNGFETLSWSGKNCWVIPRPW